MAEPATTAPSTVAELDRAALLATKLHVPRPRAGLVPRPRLLERLAEGMGRDVILVCTPAGFGKTTLLAEWARTGHRPVAWLSLDPGDNDPARFWRHAAAALDTVQPGLAERVAGLLGGLPASFEAVGARLELAGGQLDAADRWVRQRGLAVHDQPAYARERDYLVLARVLLARQAPDQALGMLQPWAALAATQGRTESRIELRALEALAHAALDDEPAALAALAEALALGAREGYLRVFVDEGRPMAAVLRLLLSGQHLAQLAGAHAVPRDYLARLAAAFEQAGTPIHPPARSAAAAVPGMIEPLSGRELEVLGLLAEGRSNKAIAEELVISLDTVKRHVSHILDKLGVANRTQAVARARDLGLLP